MIWHLEANIFLGRPKATSSASKADMGKGEGNDLRTVENIAGMTDVVVTLPLLVSGSSHMM